MKISEIIKTGKPTLSFEVFPPKTEDNFDSVAKASKEIARLQPAFMSVTYGASGGTSKLTLDIAKKIQEECNVMSLAHLTCASSSKKDVIKQIELLKNNNIKNILALRGDLQPNYNKEKADYKYAYELISDIKQMGDFCIGGACYPEGHVESTNKEEDILHLKMKVDAGLDFLTTQMFFDNNILYNFLYRIREKGITVPVFAGIMPVTRKQQIKRITSLSGTYLPTRFKAIVDKFGDNEDAMKQAGIAYATEQIIDLIASGVNNIHVYSMNNPEVAKGIKNNLSHII